ncbi:D-cysteine desulfhydrase family protein [Clostridium sp. CS001]|uniref:D-cysteine desulfhydrase family protein n=1 Tax=Clostridium sp. CS001 TaxID=2880648 RepID=UPI001CF2D588|nr:D-cysteine desulfhydrase family protein [Clostridium sp. CS001]MCB2290042.1 D-cysteine desulfhydrase family protein [Clostridium sp. CS001]
MIKIPNRIKLANLPTKIEKLDRLSKLIGGPNIYIKRDDYTGTEISGNKIRKLEFSIKEAIDMGCDYLITCGGIQSNHARATVAAAVKLGMKAGLILRGKEDTEIDGNLFINKLLGADIRFVTAEDYSNRRTEIMEELKKEMEFKGYKPYIIPEGASNGIGSFGYFNAMEEILTQEKEMGIHFDGIFAAVGSGGTHAGLLLGSKVLNSTSQIYSINVCNDENHFKNEIQEILRESNKYLDVDIQFDKSEINIVDGYVGRDYALSTPVELNFISEFAKLEGIILDPVYTGKGMYGLTEEIKNGRFKDFKNILFIHTGGLFGLFPQKDLFDF